MDRARRARAVLLHVGGRCGPLRRGLTWHPSNGLSDQRFTAFYADGAEHVGEPGDPSESERIAWVPAGQVRDYVLTGAVVDGLSLTALLAWTAQQRSWPGQRGEPTGDSAGFVVPDS